MGLPWPQAHPAEVRLARLILADHVVAAPVLLYGGATLKQRNCASICDRMAYLGTLLGVG